jgi:ferric-dicitrate binding protein FerR (iron transport regulator)
MKDPDNSPDGPAEESNVARVLKAAGARATPADDMKAAVRAAVHAEWRGTVAKRGRRRVWAALAASVIIVATALWLIRPFIATRGEVVASVSRVVGDVESNGGRWIGRDAVLANSSVHAGETLMTGPRALASLRLPGGVSLRLDHDTRIEWKEAGLIALESGAVYVDAGTTPNASRSALLVSTPAGIVRHIGTQYEARLVDDATRIRVREGRVDLIVHESGGSQSVDVGEEIIVGARGTITRGTISPSNPEWQWAANAAPSFEIDGRPVQEFLTWVGREVGREIVFATPESRAEAERAVLRGSVAGLDPAEALAAVLPTTSLRSTERDGKIEISLQTR